MRKINFENHFTKLIYDALAENLGQRAEIDFNIYYNSATHFRHLIRRKHNSYSHVVVIPDFLDDPETGYQAIRRLPKEKLIVLDKTVPGLSGDSGAMGRSAAEMVLT